MSHSVIQSRQRSLEIYLDLLLDDRLTRRADPLTKFLEADSHLERDFTILSDSEDEIIPTTSATPTPEKRVRKPHSKSKSSSTGIPRRKQRNRPENDLIESNASNAPSPSEDPAPP